MLSIGMRCGRSTKQGGEGFTRLVNHWLANGDKYARREGIEIAFKCPDAETLRLLEALATQANEGPQADGSDHDSRVAQLALARCGAWHSVIKTLVLWQGDSNREMIFARWGAEPLSDAEMEPALDALRENPNHPGAIMALGFGQRRDYLEQIVTTLAAENPEEYTPVVNACLWALTMLPQTPQTPQTSVEVLARRLSRPEGRFLIISLLARDGSERAVATLMTFLQQELATRLSPPYASTIADDAMTAARVLLRDPATRNEAMDLCRQRIAHSPEPDFFGQRLIQTLLGAEDEHDDEHDDERKASVLADTGTQDFLMQSAFQESGGVHFVGEKARAIRGLSAFSPEDAYVAALRVLKNPHGGDRDRAPHLLLEIDEARAVDDLVNHLTTERGTHLRRTCARALCEAGTMQKLRDHSLSSPAPEDRAAACFALGFAPAVAETEAAVRACLADNDVRVFEAACEALIRLNDTKNTEELAEEYLRENEESQRWIILDAALELGNVFDVSWLRKMMKDEPPLVVEYVQEKVRKRRDEEKREAETEDWRNHV